MWSLFSVRVLLLVLVALIYTVSFLIFLLPLQIHLQLNQSDTNFLTVTSHRPSIIRSKALNVSAADRQNVSLTTPQPSCGKTCSLLERFTYSNPNRSVCSNRFQSNENSVLIIVISYSTHFNYRQAIRGTWGRNGRYKTLNMQVQTVFFVGSDDQAKVAIQDEQRIYGDIVQIGIPENEPYLVYKELASLLWTRQYCPLVRRIFRIDDYWTMNTYLFLQYMKTEINFDHHDGLYGWIRQKSPVVRTGRWAVPFHEYPAKIYPDYAHRPNYLISNRTCERLLKAAAMQKSAPIRINDVYITGILRESAGIPLFAYQSLKINWNLDDLNFCENRFDRDKSLGICRINLHQDTLDQIEEYFESWNVLSNKFNISIVPI